MTGLTSQKAEKQSAIIEVRFNSLQMLAIDRALGKAAGCFPMAQEWYQLNLAHHAELARGRSVLLTFPAQLGVMPRLHGQLPDCHAEWLPVIIQALRAHRGTILLAKVMTGLYEAVAWGFAQELYALDGIFDVATMAGRQRLLARRSVMERLHGLPSAYSDVQAALEAMRHGC